jgi:hypothetical protein
MIAARLRENSRRDRAKLWALNRDSYGQSNDWR